MAPDPNWKQNVREAMRARRAKNGRTNTVFGRELRPLQLTAALKYVQIIDACLASGGVPDPGGSNSGAAVIVLHQAGTQS